MNRILTLSLCLLAWASASCVSPPEVRHPETGVELPEDWTGRAGEGEVVGQEWWSQFGDPELDSLVLEALARNHDLDLASARLEAALAQARIAGADIYPSVDFALDAVRQQQNFVGFPIPGRSGDVLTTRFNRLSTSLGTRWEVDLWGRIRSGKRAALADVRAAEEELRATRQSIAARVTLAWLELLEARQQLELAGETVESFRSSAGWIQARYDVGLRPALDLRLALSNLSSAEASLQSVRQHFDALARQLEILLGRYPAAALKSDSELPGVPPDIPAGLPADLLSRRPDLVAAERRLAASDARVREARASLYPRIALTASGGTSSKELVDLLNGDFSVWAIGGNLVQPIFNGWRLRAGVSLAEARSSEAAAAYAKLLLNALAEVETALASESLLGRRELELSRAAEQAVEARRLAEEQYRSGLTGLLVLLESQRRAVNAESQLIAARRQRLQVRVQLHLALGGDFSREESRGRDDGEGGTRAGETKRDPGSTG